MKEVNCDIKEPEVKQHEYGRWMVWMQNSNHNGGSGIGFSSDEDAKNALMLARSLQRHGYLFEKANYKLMLRKNRA